MAFNSLISGLVNTAFDTVGDLAKDITIVNTVASGYNFATGTTTTATATSVTVKGIVQKYDRPDPEAPHVTSTVLFKVSDVGELDIYDRFEFDGDTWKLSTFSDDGYVVTAVLVREV